MLRKNIKHTFIIILIFLKRCGQCRNTLKIKIKDSGKQGDPCCWPKERELKDEDKETKQELKCIAFIYQLLTINVFIIYSKQIKESKR